MRLAGREWRVLVSDVHLGRDRYRVIRPERLAAHAPAYDDRWFGAQYYVDRAAAVELAFAWWLAARSRRSLVYLPVRSSAGSCGAEFGGHALDLVLLHHSLGFPVSRWKQVRARLSPAKAHKVTMPANGLPEIDREEYERVHHREFRDHLRRAVAADTLFLVGSRRAFELEGERIRELAEDGSAQLAEYPQWHQCAEIGLRSGPYSKAVHHRRNPPGELHVATCNEHW